MVFELYITMIYNKNVARSYKINRKGDKNYDNIIKRKIRRFEKEV